MNRLQDCLDFNKKIVNTCSLLRKENISLRKEVNEIVQEVIRKDGEIKQLKRTIKTWERNFSL